GHSLPGGQLGLPPRRRTARPAAAGGADHIFDGRRPLVPPADDADDAGDRRVLRRGGGGDVADRLAVGRPVEPADADRAANPAKDPAVAAPSRDRPAPSAT